MENPADDVVQAVGRPADTREVALAGDVRLGAPDANGGRAGGVVVVLQEEVADVYVNEVRGACGRDGTDNCGQDILEHVERVNT